MMCARFSRTAASFAAAAAVSAPARSLAAPRCPGTYSLSSFTGARSAIFSKESVREHTWLLRGVQTPRQQLDFSVRANSSVDHCASSINARLGLPAGDKRPKWEIRMLYDGDCPLCMREVDMLRRMDKDAGKIDFVDIAAPDYDPSKNMDLDFETVMRSIHGILPDGRVVTGIEVFRRLYEAVGLGWVYAITKNPSVGSVAERIYNFWARNRMAVTGRPELEVILAEKKTCRGASSEQ